jgi:hypothetical protein
LAPIPVSEDMPKGRRSPAARAPAAAWDDGLKPLRLTALSPRVRACRRKFLRLFPQGFADRQYVAWERGYKWQAHEQWAAVLGRVEFESLLHARRFKEIAQRAVRIESRTNLLFSFEKMALRDAVKSPAGARRFAEGLHDLLHGTAAMRDRFDRWCTVLAALPRRQTRVLTWPVATVFGFLAQPLTHIFLKPKVTREAARAYGCDFKYVAQPSAATYLHFLQFAEVIRRDVADLKPRDMIDLQSFMWVMGSEEYE